MRVIVLAHLTGDVVNVLIAAKGPDFGRRRQVPALVFEDVAPPYFAELDADVAEPVEGTRVVSGVLSLGPKGAPTVGFGPYYVPLETLSTGLTRTPAQALLGCTGYVIQVGNAQSVVPDLGDESLADILTRLAKEKEGEATAKAAADAIRRAALAATTARSEQSRNDVFVNPYTFVPFPQQEPEGFRRAPAGHDRLATDRYSGSISLRLTTATPILTRGDNGAFPADAQGNPLLPGSSIKGALRAVHEALAGGCLRVLDTEFVPVYRDTAHVLDSTWTLAVIAEAPHGSPASFTLADEVVWTSADELHRAVPPQQLRSGTRVNIGRTAPGNHDRTNGFDLRAGGDWVVHVTDVPETRNGHPYYAACGRIGSRHAAVKGPEVWNRFQRVVDGARDLQQGDHDATVRHKNGGQQRIVGSRRLASRDLAVGDVVWVRVQGGAVAEIKLSYLWRTEGTGRLGDRVPEWLLPCTGPDLCPTCRVFGAVEDVRGEHTEASQQSYRGHIRFADAVAVGAHTRAVELAPLGRPRPGVGSFYLHHDGKKAQTRQEAPRGRWGSRADSSGLRQVRGRKFYWNADPAEQHPRRDQRGPGQTGNMAGPPVQVLPAGTELTTTIHFVNLSTVELGALLGVLQPGAVLRDKVPVGFAAGEEPLQLRFGGGKPLGYGAVDVTIDRFVVESASSRYLGVARPDLSVEAAITAFADHASAEIVALWPDLAAVLRRNHVNPARVMYPPGRPWPEEGRAESEKFREPFEFFKSVSGEYRRDEDSHAVLPSPPRNAAQQLPIVEARGNG